MEAKEDDLGKFIRLRRPVKKLFPKDDEITRFNPPKVTGAVNVTYVDADTNADVRSYKKSDGVEIKRVGEEVLIGNESRVIVNIAIYDTQQGKGHRWEAINVLDLVEYIPQEDMDDDETGESRSNGQEVQKGTKEEPKKAAKETTSDTKGKKNSKDSKPNVAEDMNDELPW